MNTRSLEDGIHSVGATRWSAIATGVFLALALQTILLLFGAAVSSSVGDGVPEGGYAFWALLVQLVSIGTGAAIAAALSHASLRREGIGAGVVVWAVALVFGGLVTVFVLSRGSSETNAWLAFFGALLSLTAAIVGGAFGTRLGRTSSAGGTTIMGAQQGTHVGEIHGAMR